MGLFFESRPTEPVVRQAVHEALRVAPDDVEDLEREAHRRADAVAEELRKRKSFNTGRFIGALIIFLSIVGAAVIADAKDLTQSSEALWGLATTIFGVVVGFLGGESTA